MNQLIAEVAVADLAKAIKSASIFAGKKDLFVDYAYVRMEFVDNHLYLVAGDQYQVAAVRVPTTTSMGGHTGAVFVTVDSLKGALANFLKPGRTKPVVQLRADRDPLGVVLVREDQRDAPWVLEPTEVPTPLPPAFGPPMSPISWVAEDHVNLVSRFAVAPELITKVAQAAWNKTDAVIVEPSGTPHKPITVRIGTYLIAVLAPKDGRNGNTTTVAPNDENTRRSWHEALTTMSLTHGASDAHRGVDQAH